MDNPPTHTITTNGALTAHRADAPRDPDCAVGRVGAAAREHVRQSLLITPHVGDLLAPMAVLLG